MSEMLLIQGLKHAALFAPFLLAASLHKGFLFGIMFAPVRDRLPKTNLQVEMLRP
jgi:hypothetical protein